MFGDEHPNALTTINNMGMLLAAQGKHAEAETYCREALEGRRRVLGDEHPLTLLSISNRGRRIALAETASTHVGMSTPIRAPRPHGNSRRKPPQIAEEKLRQFESARMRGDDFPLPTRMPIADTVTAYVEHIRAVKTTSRTVLRSKWVTFCSVVSAMLPNALGRAVAFAGPATYGG